MKKIIIPISIIVIIIITGLISLFIIKIQDEEQNQEKNEEITDSEDDIELEIVVGYYATPEGEMTFVGDLVTFELVEVVDDVEYIWNFGDGNSATGNSVTNSYAHSNYYNVSVHCNYNGKSYSNHTIVSVTNQDVELKFGSNGGDLSVRKSDSRGDGYGHSIDEGITYPEVKVDLTVENVMGTIKISVWREDYELDGSNEEELDSIEISKQNDLVTYSKSFPRSTFKGIEMPFFVSIYVNTVQGYHGDYSGTLIIDY